MITFTFFYFLSFFFCFVVICIALKMQSFFGQENNQCPHFPQFPHEIEFEHVCKQDNNTQDMKKDALITLLFFLHNGNIVLLKEHCIICTRWNKRVQFRNDQHWSLILPELKLLLTFPVLVDLFASVGLSASVFTAGIGKL